MPKEKPKFGQPLFDALEQNKLEEKSKKQLPALKPAKQEQPTSDPYASLFEDDPQAEILGPINTEIIRKRTNKADKYKH